MLGNPARGRKSQWKFPLTDDRKQVLPGSIPGRLSRKHCDGIKSLADLAFSEQFDEATLDPEQTRLENTLLCQQWNDLMDCWFPLMDNMKRHEDFESEEDIDALHVDTNAFFCLWIDLLVGTNITNYLHWIGAGHIIYFLQLYGNLYKYSNQGWEAWNKKTKLFYQHNTNHGGNCGRNGTYSGEHLRPIMWLAPEERAALVVRNL